MRNDLLSVKVTEEILRMITEEKRFAPGDKLPNEFELSEELGVSRATLREAVRVLSSQGYLEIHRGKGTYVSDSKELDDGFSLPHLVNNRVNVKDLYEMRLIFEPQAAYYAAKRATDAELEQIAKICRENEALMKKQDPRWNESEQMFHNFIASATHNKMFTSLLPIFNRAIHSGIILAKGEKKIAEDTLHDHRQIVEYLTHRNAEGARLAMHLHIINTMAAFGIDMD